MIVSKQNIKLFPPDFFIDKSKNEVAKEFQPKEIKVKSNSFKGKEENLFKQTGDFAINPIVGKPEENKHFYFDFHDEDKELLDLLKVQKIRESINNIFYNIFNLTIILMPR